MAVELSQQVFASDESQPAAPRVCFVARGFLVERIGRLVFRVKPVNELCEVLKNPLTEFFWCRVVLAQFTDLFITRTSNLLLELFKFPRGIGALRSEVLPPFRRDAFQVS